MSIFLAQVESIHQGIDLSITISRAKFEELNSDLFKKTMTPVERVLKDAVVLEPLIAVNCKGTLMMFMTIKRFKRFCHHILEERHCAEQLIPMKPLHTELRSKVLCWQV